MTPTVGLHSYNVIYTPVWLQVLQGPDFSPFIRLMPTPTTCPKPTPGECLSTVPGHVTGNGFLWIANLSFLFSFNRIDIPPYEGYDKLYDKLLTAIEETCGFAVEWDALRSIRAACSLPLLSFMLFPLLFDQLLLYSFSTHLFVVVFQGQIQNKTWVSRVCIQNNKVLNHLISSQFMKQVSVSFNFFFLSWWIRLTRSWTDFVLLNLEHCR